MFLDFVVCFMFWGHFVIFFFKLTSALKLIFVCFVSTANCGTVSVTVFTLLGSFCIRFWNKYGANQPQERDRKWLLTPWGLFQACSHWNGPSLLLSLNCHNNAVSTLLAKTKQKILYAAAVKCILIWALTTIKNILNTESSTGSKFVYIFRLPVHTLYYVTCFLFTFCVYFSRHFYFYHLFLQSFLDSQS